MFFNMQNVLKTMVGAIAVVALTLGIASFITPVTPITRANGSKNISSNQVETTKTSQEEATGPEIAPLVATPSPQITLATYLGTFGDDQINKIAISPVDGSIFVLSEIIAPNNRKDIRVTKLNSTATSIISSRTIGGDDDDIGYDLVIDKSGRPAIAGSSKSTNYPVSQNASQPRCRSCSDCTTCGNYQSDVVFTILSSDLSVIVHSTYLGGTKEDYPSSIAVDTSGNFILFGAVRSVDIGFTPGTVKTTIDGLNDFFIAKFSSTGVKLWVTAFGGSLFEYPGKMAVDGKGNIYIVGTVDSRDYVTTSNALKTTRSDANYDGVITKISPDGRVVLYSSYFAGGLAASNPGDTRIMDVAVDANGSAFITGTISSSSLLVAKIDTLKTGQASLQYLSAIPFNGVSTFTRGFSISIDDYGYVYIVGKTLNPSFPQVKAITNVFTYFFGIVTPIALKIDPQGSTVFSSYLPGFSFVNNDRGEGSCIVDKQGNVFVASKACCLFAPVGNALQPNADLTEGTILKIEFPNPTISTFTPSAKRGVKITVTGTNLSSTSMVTFNGVRASVFTVDNDNKLTVTVPSGATTGKIVVQNDIGAVATNTNFTVLL